MWKKHQTFYTEISKLQKYQARLLTKLQWGYLSSDRNEKYGFEYMNSVETVLMNDQRE